MMLLKGKKIAMVIEFIDFPDKEYFIPLNVFLSEGAEVITVSSQKGQALSVYGGTAEVNMLLKDLKPKDFDIVINVSEIKDQNNIHNFVRNVIQTLTGKQK